MSSKPKDRPPSQEHRELAAARARRAEAKKAAGAARLRLLTKRLRAQRGERGPRPLFFAELFLRCIGWWPKRRGERALHKALDKLLKGVGCGPCRVKLLGKPSHGSQFARLSMTNQDDAEKAFDRLDGLMLRPGEAMYVEWSQRFMRDDSKEYASDKQQAEACEAGWATYVEEVLGPMSALSFAEDMIMSEDDDDMDVDDEEDGVDMDDDAHDGPSTSTTSAPIAVDPHVGAEEPVMPACASSTPMPVESSPAAPPVYAAPKSSMPSQLAPPPMFASPTVQFWPPDIPLAAAPNISLSLSTSPPPAVPLVPAPMLAPDLPPPVSHAAHCASTSASAPAMGSAATEDASTGVSFANDIDTLDGHYESLSPQGLAAVLGYQPPLDQPVVLLGPAVEPPVVLLGPAVEPSVVVLGPAVEPPVVLLGSAVEPPVVVLAANVELPIVALARTAAPPVVAQVPPAPAPAGATRTELARPPVVPVLGATRPAEASPSAPPVPVIGKSMSRTSAVASLAPPAPGPSRPTQAMPPLRVSAPPSSTAPPARPAEASFMKRPSNTSNLRKKPQPRAGAPSLPLPAAHLSAQTTSVATEEETAMNGL
ncbi:uncharacterized protein LOC62_04G006217 [Vanrija pseudolonga]|uniref:Uncharacterized protein n=1 Tax=Vanrija pseudolonga TaxID=143232 RepID=A0AAF0Y9Y8_9TREE|nr:hypothetical protein LOC62_04G006217 [Vanrija pseudolonga]